MSTPRPPLPTLALWGLVAVLLGLGIAWARSRTHDLVPAAAAVHGELAWVQTVRPAAFISQPYEVRWTHHGQPVRGGTVSVDLSMPDMAMPLNRFEARPVPGAPGHYRGPGVFTMSGKWQVWVTARSPAGGADLRQLLQVR